MQWRVGDGGMVDHLINGDECPSGPGVSWVGRESRIATPHPVGSSPPLLIPIQGPPACSSVASSHTPRTGLHPTKAQPLALGLTQSKALAIPVTVDPTQNPIAGTCLDQPVVRPCGHIPPRLVEDHAVDCAAVPSEGLVVAQRASELSRAQHAGRRAHSARSAALAQ